MTETTNLILLDPEDLLIDPENLIYERDPEDDEKLRESIDQYGIQKPLLVYENPSGKYTIIDGHRRAKIAIHGDAMVPCILFPIENSLDLIKAKIAVVQSNHDENNRSVQDKYREIVFLEKYIKELKKLDPSVKGLTRKLIAENIGLKERQVADYTKIKNNLREDDMKSFLSGKINVKEALSIIDNYKEFIPDAVSELFINDENNPKKNNRFSGKSIDEIETVIFDMVHNESTLNGYKIEPQSKKKIRLTDLNTNQSQIFKIRNIAINIHDYNERYNERAGEEANPKVQSIYDLTMNLNKENLNPIDRRILSDVIEKLHGKGV